MARLKWGVLGTSNFARNKMIPALQQSQHVEVFAIASRSLPRAEAVAAQFGIAKAYGTYRELLADKDIDVVYNPLPNHLHVPWSIRALESRKHVLCEKPIGLSAAEAQQLLEASQRHQGLKVMEAFMYRMHPQWERTKQIIDDGGVGELRTLHSFFSYFNADGGNIRNQPDAGGGGLMDIGCYLIVTSRMLFGEDPLRAAAAIVRDPASGVDTLTSMTLEFPSGHAIGTCGIRTARHQRVQMLGSAGRLEVETPFSAPPDRPLRLLLDDGTNPYGAGREVIEIPPCNPYRVQGDAFARAVRSGAPAPYPLEMSVVNMRIIEAVVRSGAKGGWEQI